MRSPAVALTFLLAACGASDPGAQPSPKASASRVLTGDTKKVSDAVRATLAACPCRVTMRIYAFGDDTRIEGDFTGPWNPKSGAATLRDKSDGSQVRIVAGETYVAVPKDTQAAVGAEWLQLDFARVPAKSAPLAPFALVDPALLFALAEQVTLATLNPAGTSLLYDGVFDVVAAATALGGAKGDLLRRLVTSPSLYETVKLDAKGRVQRFSLSTTPGPNGVEGDMAVEMTVVAVNVRDPLAPGPTQGVRRINAANKP